MEEEVSYFTHKRSMTVQVVGQKTNSIRWILPNPSSGAHK